MKFIKLFESFNKNHIKEICEDILLDLQDVGFESVIYTDVLDLDQKIIPNAIAVSIGYELIDNSVPFNYDDIKEVVNRLLDYLESEGYSLQYPIRVSSKRLVYPVDDIKNLDGREILGIYFIFNKTEGIVTENSKNDPIPELNLPNKLGIILLGAPGMGKSTFANNFIRNKKIKTFSTDDVSLMFTKDPNVYHQSSSELNINRLKEFINTGQSFIYDTTGTQESNIIDIHNLAKFNGYTTIFIHVIGPLDTAIKQNKERSRQVPEEYIRLAYDRQFGNMSKFSNELHPNAYYIVQNINGKYKFSKYDSGKILKRKSSVYESKEYELDGEMILYIIDDIMDGFGIDNIEIYDFSGVKSKTRGLIDNPSLLKISNITYNTKRYKFKISVDLKESSYDKFSKLITDFNSCVKRFNDYGWLLNGLNVECDGLFRKVIFTLTKPEEEIKDNPFDENKIESIIKYFLNDYGLELTDIDFYDNDDGEHECKVHFDSKSFGGEMPANIGDIISELEEQIGASESYIMRDNCISFSWGEWDRSAWGSSR